MSLLSRKDTHAYQTEGMEIRCGKQPAFRDISSDILFEPVIIKLLVKQLVRDVSYLFDNDSVKF